MAKPDIRKDEFTPVNLNYDGEEVERVPVNSKFDRVDFYRPLGLWMLKFYSDENGLMTIYTDEENALRVVAEAELPLVEREFIFESEHEGFLTAQSSLLTDEMFGGFDEDEPTT
jgi:hypothetical protein